MASRTARLVQAAAYDQRFAVDEVVLFLPTPVSVNDIWAIRQGGKGLRLSDAYKAWLQDAGWRLNLQRPGCIRGDYELTLRLPAESGLDLDNAIKATSDLLQTHGVVRNDKLAARVILEWQRERPEAVVRVVPYAGGAA